MEEPLRTPTFKKRGCSLRFSGRVFPIHLYSILRRTFRFSILCLPLPIPLFPATSSAFSPFSLPAHLPRTCIFLPLFSIPFAYPKLVLVVILFHPSLPSSPPAWLPYPLPRSSATESSPPVPGVRAAILNACLKRENQGVRDGGKKGWREGRAQGLLEGGRGRAMDEGDDPADENLRVDLPTPLPKIINV